MNEKVGNDEIKELLKKFPVNKPTTEIVDDMLVKQNLKVSSEMYVFLKVSVNGLKGIAEEKIINAGGAL